MAKRTEDRTDHIWFTTKRDGKSVLKCCLCGGITHSLPPKPTPSTWLPITYEKLTDKERAFSPYLGEPA